VKTVHCHGKGTRKKFLRRKAQHDNGLCLMRWDFSKTEKAN